MKSHSEVYYLNFEMVYKKNPQIIEKSVSNILKRAKLCVQNKDGHFEQLL